MADENLLSLSEDEKRSLTATLRAVITEDRYPLSPRIRMLESILARLEPPKPAPPPLAAQAALRTATTHGSATAARR
jgi:hypothetical protein